MGFNSLSARVNLHRSTVVALVGGVGRHQARHVAAHEHVPRVRVEHDGRVRAAVAARLRLGPSPAQCSFALAL